MKKMKSVLFWAEDRLRSLLASGLAARLTAGGMILFLMLADFQNLQATFLAPAANTSARNAFWFSLTLCLALEGFPTFLGMNVSVLTDKTRHKANDKTSAIVGSVVSGAGSLLVFALFVYIKSIEIAYAGGKQAFLNGTYALDSASYMVQILLLWSPIVTSMMAFVVSWCYCSAEAKYKLQRQTENARRRMLHADRRYLHQAELLELCRTQLWAKVSAAAAMPRTLTEYRAAVCGRIRNLIVENVITLFPAMVGRYQQAVECRLQAALHQMAGCSNIPLAIESIELDKELAAYDAAQPDDGLAWDTARALPVLQHNLKHSVDNAVVQAQTKMFGAL